VVTFGFDVQDGGHLTELLVEALEIVEQLLVTHLIGVRIEARLFERLTPRAKPSLVRGEPVRSVFDHVGRCWLSIEFLAKSLDICEQLTV